MNILFAGIFHETHCFVSETTSLADFKIELDAAILSRRGDGSQVDGFIEVADREQWTILPTVLYTATPAGTVEDAVLESYWRDLIPRATNAAAKGVDAVFLSLHGAMATANVEDVEGELLQRLRAIPGLERVPFFGVFDLHANLTQTMADGADCLVCYRENPHIDARDSGVRAAELLARTLGDGLPLHTAYRSVPVIWPPTGTGTADTPMRDLEALARKLEADHPAFRAVNVVAGFSFADVHDAGVAFSIVTAGAPAEAEAALDELAAMALALRETGLVPEMETDEALDRAAAFSGGGPVLLVEPSDNIGGGAPGNSTGVLRAFLKRDVENAAVIINDPEAVRDLERIAPGGRATLAIGGKGNPFDAGPVTLDVELIGRSDGRFDLEDLNSHLVASQGRHINMGPSAVVRHRGITILLTTYKTPPNDLGQLRSQGIIPETLALIGVKAAVAHRRAYDPIAAASFNVRTPGPCTSDPASLPYRRLRRPIFPLDQ